jgi:hypothetical protein
MRVGFLSLALIIVAFAGVPGSTASATRIAFAQPQQPRNQTQSQEGLPPEQKKKISNYDPADVFGVSGEDPRRQAGKPQRRPQPTPTLQAPPSQRSSTTSAATPNAQPSATPVQSSTAEPSPTVAAGGLGNGLQQSPLSQGDSSDKIAPKWAAPLLIVMALIVSAALVFTLTKLVEKIRESSSG